MDHLSTLHQDNNNNNIRYTDNKVEITRVLRESEEGGRRRKKVEKNRFTYIIRKVEIPIDFYQIPAGKSAQELRHSFMIFSLLLSVSVLPSSLFGVCPSFLWCLKIEKRHAWDSSIILFQQKWQQQLLFLPLIHTVIMVVLMLVRKLSTQRTDNIIL